MKKLNILTAGGQLQREQINRNKQDIFNTNAVMFQKSVFFAMFLFLALFFISFVFPDFAEWKAPYGVLFAIFTALYTLCTQQKIVKIKLFPTLGLYLIFEIGFLFAIYLSAIASPNHRATVILALFCLVPLYILDASSSINLFVVFNCVLHTVLVFLCKPQSLAVEDTVNCIAIMAIGIFSGENVRSLKLSHFDLSKANAQMAEIDFLTGLYNRRKMYELLQEEHSNIPVAGYKGAIMLDIDHFKTFNDSYGHSAGDECLRTIGRLLCDFGKQQGITFFRYGGEEFIGFECTGNHDRLQAFAEKLRLAVLDAGISFPASEAKVVSVSIGYCSILSLESGQKEQMIKAADKALYHAKGTGRNRCVGYTPDM